jgi:hypothetical protein
MTGRWWIRTAAAQRLGKTLDEIEALIATGDLDLHSIVGDHEVISEASIEDYERKQAKPVVERWSRASDPGAFADRADYTDTPNDEGDNEQ